MHARGAVGCIAQGCAQGGGCARRPDGPTRARTRVARDGFESASTHEAVELPAGVAALHTALAKVDRDHFAHGCCFWFGVDVGICWALLARRRVTKTKTKTNKNNWEKNRPFPNIPNFPKTCVPSKKASKQAKALLACQLAHQLHSTRATGCGRLRTVQKVR